MAPQPYALVREGAVVAWPTFDPAPPEGSVVGAHETKPYLLPVTDVRSLVFDPVAEVEEGPVVTLGPTAVARVWTVRPKNSAELAQMRAAVNRRLEAEFSARARAPIAYLGRDWHGDGDAVQNIQGVVTLILAGRSVENPRNWTPKDALTPILLSHEEIIGLGEAIAGRKDALFVVKKQKQTVLAGLDDPHDIDAFDVDGGWE